MKALIPVGVKEDDTFLEPIGSVLELVPERDPTWGGNVAFRVLFRHAPLPSLRLELLTHDGAVISKQLAVSDDAGRVQLYVPSRGAHVIRAVHMTRCIGCADADWQSDWTAMTFPSRKAHQQVTAPDASKRVPLVASAAGGNPPLFALGIVLTALGLAMALWDLRRRRGKMRK